MNKSIRWNELELTAHNYPNNAPTILISAAEQSADTHGAALIKATRQRIPAARFIGCAGPQMADAGCQVVYDMTSHAAMLLSAWKLAGKTARMFAAFSSLLQRQPFDAAVVIDSPTLHLPLAARTHAAGIPTLYYIAPQMWAWGAHRIYKLRHTVDTVASILPFEEPYFRRQGINARYVGHPLIEQFAQMTLNQNEVESFSGLGEPFVALLPGSRRHVVESILPGQMEVAAAIKAAIPNAGLGVSIANDQVESLVKNQARQSGLPSIALTRSHHELIAAADLVLVASGTTALEVAFHGKPMIVMYNASRVFYHLVGRWMLNTQHLSLPNIIAGKRIVPEFMPYYTTTKPIRDAALSLLTDSAARQAMQVDLRETVASLGKLSASETAAKLLGEMINHAEH